jgi:uncharacterized protein YoxC
MIISIVILSVAILVTGLYLIACLYHLKAIRKELDAISNEQSTQNADIRGIAIHARDLTIAHNELEKQKPYVIKSYYGPPGSA